jgi:S-DNA-T family DNA segregation ATPase FtsK/SpoIIIE
MMLHCTLVPAPGSALATGPVELSIELPATCSGVELQAAISRRYGTRELSVDRVPVSAFTVGERPLVDGAVLVDGAAPAAAPDSVSLVLAVHSGPGAGLVVPLRRGRFRIGRSGTEIVVPDAELSREHALLDVSDSAVTLLDLGSANGISVNGKKVQAATLSTEAIVRCGGSSMSLVFCGTLAPGVQASAGSDVSAPLVVSNPAVNTNRAALMLATVLPLAIGAGLAVVTGMWIFLAFTAVSAVSILVPAVSGRRQRRELRAALAAAAHEDKERRRRAAPSAGELSLRVSFDESDPSTDVPAGTGPVWLRLGLATQAANIRLEPPDSGFRPPLLGILPVTLDPGTTVTTLRGPQAAVAGLLRSFVLQLACYPAARRTRILIHGPTRFLLAARFLAAATLSTYEAATLETLAAGPGGDHERGVLIIVEAPETAALRAAAARNGWQVLDCAGDPDAGSGSAIVLNARAGRLSSAGSSLEFTPDLVPADVFDRNCRRLRARAPSPGPRAGIPAACSLGRLVPFSARDIARRWTESAAARGLPVVVGVGGSGPLRLDLQADGPHFLVAGTTGSGKSEFLRTLAAALAAAHPPGRVNLLFIDFKGGSGLRPLAGLAHCVGLLTDLDTNEVARALVSLRAEVRRREELLAASKAADLTAYESANPSGPLLPHLVIIIDEFRMLVDEAPAALAELMRIAAIGRSLGIHLIMATQRPQGAVTADIRANVTSSIALRVQSEMESIDIINSRLAAAIPITSPGRAYLVRGNEAPEEFQSATVTSPVQEMARRPTVIEAMEFLNRPPAGSSPGLGGSTAPQSALAVAQLTEIVAALWEATGGSPPRRPVAAPLPRNLPFPADGSRNGIRLGLLDLPEEQRVAEFDWLPAAHGHLGLISGNNGGADDVVELIVDQLLSCEDESHLYLLDAAGSFTEAAEAPRVGAVVGLHELRRAVRVLERLTEEMTRRLSTAHTASAPSLVLALCGWGSWVSAFRSGPLAWAEDLVQDLVRGGARAGITVLVAGERELVTSRFFAAVPNRIFLPAGSTEEGRLGWPRLPVGAAGARRAVVFGPISPASSPTGHVGQLFGPVSPAVRNGNVTRRTRPFRVEPFPRLVTVAEVRSRKYDFPPPPGHVCLGVGGDELLPAGIQLPQGDVLAVLGGQSAGKTSLLAALPGLNPGASWLRAPSATDPERHWAGVHEAACSGALDPSAILVVDDLDLQSPEANSRLLLVNRLGWRVVLTAGFSPGIRQRVPLVQNPAGQVRGVLIAPRSLLDGELFGVRFELEQSPPPGRAVVISDGRSRVVQLAFDPAADHSARGP